MFEPLCNGSVITLKNKILKNKKKTNLKLWKFQWWCFDSKGVTLIQKIKNVLYENNLSTILNSFPLKRLNRLQILYLKKLKLDVKGVSLSVT